MIYREVQQDLFSVPKDYCLAHCISADFKLGAGIAVEFNKRFNCKQELYKLFPATWISYWDGTQEKFRGTCKRTGRVFNLITKRNYWNKPTLLTIRNALIVMKKLCLNNQINKVAMPKIGCGLDKCNFDDVRKIIKDVFANVDMEILICYK